MNKQPERTAETRNNYIEAFIQLMKKKPVEKITISEISVMTGYNRSTFYCYFNDIYDLLSYIEDDLLLYINEMIVSQIGKEKTDSIFIEVFTNLYTEKIDLLKVLLANQNYSNFPNKLKNTLIPIFAKQMGVSLENEESVYKLDFYLSGIISVHSRWLSGETPMVLENYALLVKEIVKGIEKSEIFSLF